MNYTFISIITGKLPETLEIQGAFRLPELPPDDELQLIRSRLAEMINKRLLIRLVFDSIVSSFLLHYKKNKTRGDNTPDFYFASTNCYAT
jgi:hypothetical protein